ncbi:MAG: hypothetical protein DI601_13660 [Azospirillum brasilense]|nr:MAG: hypothetical protein DI601_13660 [Azospirillum brasilense]
MLVLLAATPLAAAPNLRGTDDLRGKEVWAMDETRIGTVNGVTGTASSAVVKILPNPALGIGTAPFSVPASLLRDASEGRLVLDMTPWEFEASVVKARAGVQGKPPAKQPASPR